MPQALEDCDFGGQAVCVMDLNTGIPGLPTNDFGDSIRFGASHSAKDEPDLSKMNSDLALYKARVQVFLEGGRTDGELDYLAWGPG